MLTISLYRDILPHRDGELVDDAGEDGRKAPGELVPDDVDVEGVAGRVSDGIFGLNELVRPADERSQQRIVQRPGASKYLVGSCLEGHLVVRTLPDLVE